MGDNNGYLPFPKGFSTNAIHVAQDPDQWEMLCVVPPMIASTTYKQLSPAKPKKYEYARSANPNRDILEKCLAKMENAKYGLCFASGLGATMGFLGAFEAGDHIIYTNDLYGGTNRFFKKIATRFGITSTSVDATKAELVEAAIQKNTKAVWIETPTNPTLQVIDIRAVSAVTKRHNLVLAVDNTFLTPYLQRPLELGADVVIHSLSKYLNGHSDVIMGALLTSNDDIHEKFRFIQNAAGIIPSPYDCYMINRSLKTLAVRMRQHNANGIAIAKFLESHPKVEKVLHPGLTSHPQHDIFKSQTSGHSGMVSVYIKGGLEESNRFLKELKVFTLAESLGGYESLAELPSIMTHASVPEEERKMLKITDNLIRLSVGLEDVDDLIEDLDQALAAI